MRTLGHNLGKGGPRNDGVDQEWGGLTESALFAALDRSTPLPGAAAPLPADVRALKRIPGMPRYDWVAALGSALPLMVWEGWQLIGTLEGPGAKDNPVILAWAKETGLRTVFTADAVPWCGLFMAVVAKRAAKPIPQGPAWALNWSKFGVSVGQPGLGDVLTFTRNGGGHVGLYIGEDETAFHVLGGNQADAVNITRIEKGRLYAARRPAYRNPPASVRPYVLAASGALSRNEA